MSVAIAAVVAMLVVSAVLIGWVMRIPETTIPEPLEWVPFVPTWTTVKTTTVKRQRCRVMSRPNDPYPKEATQ